VYAKVFACFKCKEKGLTVLSDLFYLYFAFLIVEI
jgi:hypothetical protein